MRPNAQISAAAQLLLVDSSCPADSSLQVDSTIPADSSLQANSSPQVNSSLQADSLKPGAGRIGKAYANKAAIEALNASFAFVTEDVDLLWVVTHLFDNEVLPRPFDVSAVRDSEIWSPRIDTTLGGDTFRAVPTLNELESKTWLNTLGEVLGITHGILD